MENYKSWRYGLAIISVFLLLSFGLYTSNFANYRSSVFAKEQEQEEQNNKEDEAESAELKEASEPAETPELKEFEQEQANEKEVEKVKNRIEQQIKRGEVKNIEINGSGKVKIQKKNKQEELKTIQPTKADFLQAQVQNTQVSLNVNQNGRVTITNNGVTVTTSHPVIIDPATSSIAVRTPTGTAAIFISPSAAVEAIPQKAKPLSISSASLDIVDNRPAYNFLGIQTRKLFGVIPVSANIQTTVDSRSGQIIQIKQPWYFKLLGFISTI